MPVSVVGRATELRAVADFVAATGRRPSGLLIGGEAGIGKTTLWLSALDFAREAGCQVLSARAWEAESVLAHGTVADLLSGVEPAVVAQLPEVQRVAVDRLLMRDVGGGPQTDQHVLAAALVSVVEALAADAPVVVGIDDLQWLDPSSRVAVAFLARRMRGRAGLVGTERTASDSDSVTSWLHFSRPDALARLHVRALSVRGLHELLADRLGRTFPRPTLARIAEMSGGNPFYALEMARAVDIELHLPSTLAELMRLRIGDVEPDTADLLLAAACLPEPTVDVLAQATGGTVASTTELLDQAQSRGLVEVTGNRVRYAHPLLARAVYTEAGGARRRRMHRAVAETLADPELKARHLALAASSNDPELIKALDDAAAVAQTRGAPAAAAELLDLAIKLGGDKPSRRIRSASNHLKAGDVGQAHEVLAPALDELRPGTLRALALNLLAGIWVYQRSFGAAADALKRALDDAKDNDGVLAQTLLMLSFAQANNGEYKEALHNSEEAVSRAEALGVPSLISQALADRQVLSALCGLGYDEQSLCRALELDDPDVDVPIPFRAHSTAAQVLAWAGRLEEAHGHMEVLKRRCAERGADSDMLFVAVWSALIDVWRADFTEGAEFATEAVENAEQMGGDHSMVIALTVRGLVNAYTGRVEQARADAHAAIDAAARFGAPLLAEWPIMTLGFLEVSLGNHEQALAHLEPLVSTFGNLLCHEIIKTGFVPDAVEAMVAVGRTEDAVPLTDALELSGRRLDRPWMLAVAARCRAMLHAAAGDLEHAEECAREAMTQHQRLEMPFEEGRTQLLLGQIQRRQRQKRSAAAMFAEALATFERLGTPLWAQRVHAEQARTNVTPTGDTGLTPSERRVAELAAAGMSNRDVASTLFISAKTVEANLTQIYRKLGIRSRAELGRRMGPPR